MQRTHKKKREEGDGRFQWLGLRATAGFGKGTEGRREKLMFAERLGGGCELCKVKNSFNLEVSSSLSDYVNRLGKLHFSVQFTCW
jgi:hypothetical protein